MYCKHCGKQIADDSCFCQYCGGGVTDESLLKENDDEIPANKEFVPEESASEILIIKKSNPIQVEILEKKTDNSSSIANEMIGNLKMVGIALGIFLAYMIGFVLIHAKDAKPLEDYNHWGESCYDPTSISGPQMLLWQQHYAKNVSMAPNYKNIRKNISGYSNLKDISCANNFEPISAVDYSFIMGMNGEEALSYANREAKEKDLPQSLLEQLESAAKRDAEQDQQEINDEISGIRRNAFKEDVKKNAIYVAIISFVVMILGRYFIKVVKWVNANKTRQE